MFNYDWFHNGGLARQVSEAKRRCARRKFPNAGPADANAGGNGALPPESQAYYNELETRTILYMKDGLTYEMREIADIGTSSALAFECVPVDDNYKVGAYVIVVPFEDIARVEVFAVHPREKPQENIRIPGFRGAFSEQNQE